MGVLDRFERRVENAMSSAFSRAFRTQVKPVEIVAALKNEADARAAVLDRRRTVVPNEYDIVLGTADLERIDEWGADALARECEEALRAHADQQRYAFVGHVTVRFVLDESLSAGRLEIDSRSTRGPAAPATSSTNTNRPLLDIDGRRYSLTGETTVVGRGEEADIMVPDSGISREHLKFEVTEYGTILTDLGSTNGTFVEDQQVQEVTLVDGNAITIGRTTIMYWDPVSGGER